MSRTNKYFSYAIIGVCILAAGVLLYDASKSDPDNLIFVVDEAIHQKIDDQNNELKLDYRDKEYLLTTVRNILNSQTAQADHYTHTKQHILNQSAGIVVTAWNNNEILGQEHSHGKSLIGSARNAAQALATALKRNDIASSDYRITVTILINPQLFRFKWQNQLESEIERGIHALKLHHNEKQALFLPHIPIIHNYTLGETLINMGKEADIIPALVRSPASKLYRYNTITFTENQGKKPAKTVYRNNLIRSQAKVTPANLIKALHMIGSYLEKQVDQTGRFSYQYEPTNDKKIYDTSSVAAVRGLASTWALAATGKYLNNANLLNAAKQSLHNYFNHYYIYDESKDIGYLRIDNQVNIATAAFAILTLETIEDDSLESEKKEKLINFILYMEDKNKGYIHPIYPRTETAEFKTKELYYPGEAMTALMSLYSTSGNKRYLDVCKRVFNYYRRLFEVTSRKMSLAPWMTRAYSQVFLATREEKYALFVFEMNDYLISMQRGLNEQQPDAIGSFFDGGSYGATAVFIESIAAAYLTAQAIGDEKRINTYRRAILMGDRFVLQGQYAYDSMFFVKNPDITVGGIRSSIYSSTVRSDAVQHSAFAFLDTLKNVYNKRSP